MLSKLTPIHNTFQINETYQHPGKWHDVVLQPGKEETFSHAMSHNIRGLEPGSVFEAIVQAKNRYGWNQVSDLYQFYTRGYGEHYADLGKNKFIVFDRLIIFLLDIEENGIMASSTKSNGHRYHKVCQILTSLSFLTSAVILA